MTDGETLREWLAEVVHENGLRAARDASAHNSGADEDYLRDVARDIVDALLLHVDCKPRGDQ